MEGDSDEIIFQANLLRLIGGPGGKDVLLQLRTCGPGTTVNQLFDNQAARKAMRDLGTRTSIADPILPAEGKLGFELINTCLNHLTGGMAASPRPRRTWLIMLTSEDRQVVRKCCIRIFLIQPDDLKRFLDWGWCRNHVRLERPWHWYRIVTLHRAAQAWAHQESDATGRRKSPTGSPSGGKSRLVDDQAHHERIVTISMGLCMEEPPLAEPPAVDWQDKIEELERLGFSLPAAQANT